ncbi:MAG TPA: PDZ domain-containing protein [Opitutus sp.]|nr:PDZ domain-containing protein [Opitutus sp.]
MKGFPIVLAALTVLSALGLPARTADEAGDNAKPPVVLPGVQVTGHPWTCFGLSFVLLGDRHTRQISHLIIWRVAEHSEAEFKGIKPGDQILTADDTPVTSFKVDFKATHNRFRDLFVNRNPGDRIKLKLIHPHASKPFTLFLTEPGERAELPSWMRRR